jgi:hypothetical protein
VADVLPEQSRNRLLRRVDWRFLLPSPRAERCVCFATGMLADAVGLIADRVWQPGEVPSDAACDLAVAADPGADTLRTAWRTLQPGGWLYAEWHARISTITFGARRKLEGAGFVDVSFYAPQPDPAKSAPSVWLPIASDGAVRHHVTHAVRPRGGWLRRTAQRLCARLWLAHRHLRIASPLCAIARKPSSNGTAAPLPSFALDVLYRAAAPERLAWTLLTGGRRSVNKVLALGFSGADETPRLAVKIGRVPESADALLREARALETLQAQRTPIHGVPRLLFCRSQNGIVAVGQTALIGQPFARVLRRDNALDLALRATDWLTGLAVDTPPLPPPDWRDRIVHAAVSEFERSYESVLDPALLRDALHAVETLGSLPPVHEQRDFAPWNLLLTRDAELAVLDWESAQLCGLPLLDLTYFLTYAAFYLERAPASGRFRETYRATLDPGTFVGSIAARCVGRYAARLALPSAFVRPLRILTWMVHAPSELRQFMVDMAGPPAPGLLRRGLFLALWEEEVRHATTA